MTKAAKVAPTATKTLTFNVVAVMSITKLTTTVLQVGSKINELKEKVKELKESISQKLYWANYNIEKEDRETGTTFIERVSAEMLINAETDGLEGLFEEMMENAGRKAIRTETRISNEELFKKMENDATKNRVKPRKNTIEKVKINQPKNEKGEMIDPYSKEPLKNGETDLGHKKGQE